MIAFTFCGQGAQYPGMMYELYQEILPVRKVYQIADSVLGRSISDLCFHGTIDDLTSTHNTQPCVLAADIAVYEALKAKGISPSAVAGFSLGEYAALAAAGVLSMEDAFQIVQIRADVMQDAVPVDQGAMAAIMNVDAQTVISMCEEVDGFVVPANFNSPKQIVVSGISYAVDALLLLAKERKIRALKLPVSAPFHCKLMEPAKRKLEEIFRTASFHDAVIPIYMNIDGEAHMSAEEIRKCVLQQTVSPVQWVRTLTNLKNARIDHIIECGPGMTLSGFARKTIPDVDIYNVESPSTLIECLRMCCN